MSVIVIIPAVVEPDVDQTIQSLLDQTRVPDRIIVAVNNAGGDPATEISALSLGSPLVEVRDLGEVPTRKAGAINRVLETLPREGYIMVMDADTTIVPTFIERALQDLADPRTGATGAVFEPNEVSSYLELCQRLEWVRYREENLRGNKTWNLSGTAAIIKWEALDSIYSRFGRWYDEESITEDGRMTVDLKVCGWHITSPVECAALTEVMPTWKMLVKQRTRWYLGALQTVARAPLTWASFPYLRQQVLLGFSVLILWALILLTIYTVVVGTAEFSLFWSCIGLIFLVERLVTIPGENWKIKVFAAAIIPEFVYALVLQYAFVRAFGQFITRSTGEWSHLTRKTT